VNQEETKRFYDSESRAYERLRFESPQGRYINEVQKSSVLTLLGDCRGKVILEIGSGTGRFTKELAIQGAHVICVDISRKMHQQARLKSEKYPVDYYVMNGTNLAFRDSIFDGCLAINVINHIEDYEQVLAEISRVLKKRGFFVANFPNMLGIYLLIGFLVNVLGRSLQAPVYSHWYTPNEVFTALNKVGLRMVESLGHIIIPEHKFIVVILRFFVNIDRAVRGSKLKLISGNLFVKSCKIK